MPAKNYASTRYSTLDQINTGNVGAPEARLDVLHRRRRAATRRRRSSSANTMYVVTPFPNFVYALDLTKPGAPMKWNYEPKPRRRRRAWPAATS